jgi:hypothetical protein
MLTDNKTQIRQLMALKDKVRTQILGNDYYIAQDLNSLEKKIDEKIKELAQMPKDEKEMI